MARQDPGGLGGQRRRDHRRGLPALLRGHTPLRGNRSQPPLRPRRRAAGIRHLRRHRPHVVRRRLLPRHCRPGPAPCRVGTGRGPLRGSLRRREGRLPQSARRLRADVRVPLPDHHVHRRRSREAVRVRPPSDPPPAPREGRAARRIAAEHRHGLLQGPGDFHRADPFRAPQSHGARSGRRRQAPWA